MKIANYKNNEVGKESYVKVTEEEVNAELLRIVSQNKNLVTKDGKSENGDTVRIDFEGFLDGVPFEGGKGEKYDLALGSHTFIPGFEEQLVGYEAGADVDVNVTFPENYQAENLAGKPVVFKCKIHEVLVNKEPELNDDLAKQFGLNTIDEMRVELTKQMNAKREDEVLTAYLDKLCKVIIDNSDIDVTDEAKDRKMNEMIAYYEANMAQYGATLESYLQMTGMTLDAFKAQLLEQAIPSIKVEVLLDEVAKLENLVATDEEVEEEVLLYKSYYNLDDEKVAQFKEERLADLKVNIVRRKVSLFLVQNNN